MQTNSSILNEKAARDFLQELGEKITASTSRYPDPPETLRLYRRVGSARQAIVLIFICSYFAPWQTDILIRNIGQKAYLNNYHGEWEKVQEILEHSLSSPMEFLEAYLKDHSVEDFFGNVAKEALKEMQMIKFKSQLHDETGTQHFRRRVRRRGYRDHGTLRLIHQFHGEPPVAISERIDRRSQISHPLLSGSAEKSAVAQHGAATTSSKGGEKDVKENN